MSERPREPDVLDVASGVSFVITDSPDLDEMLSVVARRVAEALGVWECDIYEYRPESDALVATALWSPELSACDREWLGTVYGLAERPSYELLLRERAAREYQVDDPSLGAADAEIMRRWGELSVLSVPLVFQDDVIGALTLVEKRAPRRFSPDDLRLLEILAVPAAVAVHNARLFRREAEQNRRLQAPVLLRLAAEQARVVHRHGRRDREDLEQAQIVGAEAARGALLDQGERADHVVLEDERHGEDTELAPAAHDLRVGRPERRIVHLVLARSAFPQEEFVAGPLREPIHRAQPLAVAGARRVGVR